MPTKRKSGVIIPIKHEESLEIFGFPANQRKKALVEASKLYSKRELIAKLNAIAVFNRNQCPARTRKLETDINFVRSL